MKTFIVPGKPQGKGRPIFGRPRGTFVTTRTPDKTVLYENWIKICFNEVNAGRKPIPGSVYLGIVAYFPIPTSWSKKKQAQARSGGIHPTVKPDFDNIAKVVGDALSGSAWLDDKQVVEAEISKVYDDDPRLVIEIDEC